MKGENIGAFLKRFWWILAVCVGSGALVSIWLGSRTSVIEPPLKVWKLYRSEYFYGDSARTLIREIHGIESTASENITAEYAGPDGCGRLTESFYKDEAAAGRHLISITKNDAAPDAADYSPYRKIEIERMTMFLSEGRGKMRYSFAYRNGLFWFSIDTPAAKSVIREFLKYLRTQ
jgi:hypothetical protein